MFNKNLKGHKSKFWRLKKFLLEFSSSTNKMPHRFPSQDGHLQNATTLFTIGTLQDTQNNIKYDNFLNAINKFHVLKIIDVVPQVLFKLTIFINCLFFLALKLQNSHSALECLLQFCHMWPSNKWTDRCACWNSDLSFIKLLRQLI